MLEPSVIYEDNDILVIDKPSGMVVTDAQTVKVPTIQQWISKNFDFPLVKSHTQRSGIVHRLDKETSGILLIGKNLASFEKLQNQFKNREVSKTYYCLVHGAMKSTSGVIDAPVGRLPWNRERFGVLPGGRGAVTKYRLIAVYEKGNDKYSYLEVNPKTGRTHQIRIHLKHLGHPLVSDNFYAGRKTARNDRLWCKRIFLHAGKISFIHPTKKQKINFEAKLPGDLTDIIKNLSKVAFTASSS